MTEKEREEDSMSLRIGIIGPARGQDLTLEVWQSVLEQLETFLASRSKAHSSFPFLPLPNITLVSGGAAFCDHSAVIMANKFNLPLELHLPCEWDKKHRKFKDNGHYHWKMNPGRLSNKLHYDFSQVTGIPSLKDLDRLINPTSPDDAGPSVKVHIHKGFHARNLAVSKVDVLIAFCRGQERAPQSGGTMCTWCKSSAKIKICFPLQGKPKKDQPPTL